MISVVIMALAIGLILTGLAFMAVAAVGFVRLPDIFCRLHVTGILDTLGAPLVLLGTAVWIGPTLTAGKLLLALCLLFVSSPLVGHLLSRAALEATGGDAATAGRSDAAPGEASEAAGKEMASADEVAA